MEFLFYDGNLMKIEELGNLLSSSYHSLRAFFVCVCVFFTLFLISLNSLINLNRTILRQCTQFLAYGARIDDWRERFLQTNLILSRFTIDGIIKVYGR